MRWLYIAFNLVILLPCLVISSRLKIDTHKKTQRLLIAYALVSVPFILWDIFATSRGHWSFAKDYTLGISLFGLPVEEIAFFFTVPFGCMLVWDSLKRVQGRISRKYSMGLLVGVSLASAAFMAIGYGREYTQLVTAVALFTVSVLFWTGRHVIEQKRFWAYQAICVGLFIVFNLYLTAIPIVSYGAMHNLGIRFMTIPIEDFFFNFALLNLFLLAYTRQKK